MYILEIIKWFFKCPEWRNDLLIHMWNSRNIQGQEADIDGDQVYYRDPTIWNNQ